MANNKRNFKQQQRQHEIRAENMYQMALKNRLAGFTFWPMPFLSKKHFGIISSKLLSDREEPVFTFLARIDDNAFETLSYNSYSDQDGNKPNTNGRGFFSAVFNLLFGWLITPFALNQMWAAFCLTNNNKLYFSHYSWPFSYASKAASMIVLPDDLRIDQQMSLSNPYYGQLTFLSVRGNQSLTITWKRQQLHLIYQGITNNVQKYGHKFVDEDDDVMY